MNKNKIAIESETENYKYLTDDSRECDTETAFIVSSQNSNFNSDKCCCRVDISELSEIFGLSKIKIIGITGTNGKTTISSLIYSILLDLGYKVALQGTRGFFINDKQVETRSLTTPPILETYRHIYQAVYENCDYFVMEVSSHAIVQKRIETLDFAIKIHTNITGDHLDFHKTMAEYISVKNSFFADESLKLINSDDKNIKYNLINGFSYSVENGSNFKALAYSLKDGVSAVLQYKSEVEDFHSQLYGMFNLYNILGAIGGIKLLTDKSLREICDQVENFGGVAGRMESVSREPLVIVDFAHTPDGFEQVLSSVSNRKIITVFGAGGDRDKTKRPLMGKIAQKYSEYVIITTDNPRNEDPDLIINEIINGIENKNNVEIIIDRKKAIARGLDLIDHDNGVLMILGKGDEPYQIIYDKYFKFDDREIARELINLKLGL